MLPVPTVPTSTGDHKLMSQAHVPVRRARAPAIAETGPRNSSCFQRVLSDLSSDYTLVGSNKKGGVPQEPIRIKKCLAMIHQVATDMNIGSTVQVWQNRPTQLGLCRLTKKLSSIENKKKGSRLF